MANAVKMNSERAGWSRRYQKALGKHLARGRGADMRPALGLGREAVALELETLDVALIHGQALMALVLPGGSSRIRQERTGRAADFFVEAIGPIEKTHRAALKADTRVDRLTRTLCRQTAASSASTRHLKRGIAQRQAAEAALKRSAKRRAELLKESGRLRNLLRHQARKTLAAQEDERRKTSRQLHDDIAQALLAINVRLLALKGSARTGSEDLKKEIAETQRLVRSSVTTIHRLAHEFGVYHETQIACAGGTLSEGVAAVS